MDKYEALKKYYGYDSFREGQESIVDALLAGRDVSVIMPTGGGKSICYQIPAVVLPGTAVVISPLISLMEDQVTALQGYGIEAAYLNSSLSSEEARAVYSGLWRGQYKIVYVAPERLAMQGFLSAMQSVKISLIAVDEAHCISQWGQDFRPSYLKIADFIAALPQRPPVAALTATATEKVREDITANLCLREPLQVVTGFDRPNLYFGVVRGGDKDTEVLNFVRARRDRCGIVYCGTRKSVEAVCGMLCEAGIAATRYHAGLEDEEKSANQAAFQNDEAAVMVATNAFGMGIDKSNVSYVLHYNMPKSIEAYYQEAGRAGRDGSRAECVLLFSQRDVQLAEFLISNGNENDELTDEEREQVRREDYRRLHDMEGYCKGTKCLRSYMLKYFGQPAAGGCGNCSSCLANYTQEDITTQAQMILACVQRIRKKLGFGVGAGTVAKVLKGSADKKLIERGLDEISTYGLMSGRTLEEIRTYIEILQEQGYVYTDPEYRTLHLSQQAGGVLFRGEKVTARILHTMKKTPASGKAGRLTFAPPEGVDAAMYEALRRLRASLAARNKIPAYLVFSNATLSEMAQKKPQTMQQFRALGGVGDAKAEKYGRQFLAEIKKHTK